jgi:hypothetical protein
MKGILESERKCSFSVSEFVLNERLINWVWRDLRYAWELYDLCFCRSWYNILFQTGLPLFLFSIYTHTYLFRYNKIFLFIIRQNLPLLIVVLPLIGSFTSHSSDRDVRQAFIGGKVLTWSKNIKVQRKTQCCCNGLPHPSLVEVFLFLYRTHIWSRNTAPYATNIILIEIPSTQLQHVTSYYICIYYCYLFGLRLPSSGNGTFIIVCYEYAYLSMFTCWFVQNLLLKLVKRYMNLLVNNANEMDYRNYNLDAQILDK